MSNNPTNPQPLPPPNQPDPGAPPIPPPPGTGPVPATKKPDPAYPMKLALGDVEPEE